jgi:hypothetical protein
MKNSKIVFLSVIVSIFFIVASYAAWNDNLSLTGTVSTGELNVEFMGDSVSSGDDFDSNNESGYVNCIVETNSNKLINVRMSNLYPGAGALVSARIDNKGTIPALVDNVEVDFLNSNEGLKNNLYVACGFIHYDENNNEKDSKFFISGVTSMQGNLNNLLKNVRLEPGDYLKLAIPQDKISEVEGKFQGFVDSGKDSIAFYLDYNAGNEIENKAIAFNLKMNFKQHN